LAGFSVVDLAGVIGSSHGDGVFNDDQVLHAPLLAPLALGGEALVGLPPVLMRPDGDGADHDADDRR
jgi:hypothetical protein